MLVTPDSSIGRHARPGGRAWPLLVLITLTAVYAAAYGSFVGSFFAFDDFAVLAEADRIHLHAPVDLLRFFEPSPSFLLYRPLTTLGWFWLARALFGVDPVSWSVALLGVHVANAVLVYAIAHELLRSRPGGLATALVYASAPGHALAVRWFAFFTITGTALVYFAGLWIWLCARPRWRTPATLAAFVIGLLCSEHAVSFPVGVTAIAVLAQGRRDWLRLAREIGPLWAVAATYVAAKALYIFVFMPRWSPTDAAYIAATGYGLSFDPLAILATLGRYVTAAVAPLYAPHRSLATWRAVGAAFLGLAGGVVAVACRQRARGTSTGVAACGVVLFLAGIAQVLFLPRHVYSAYVGVATLGAALAIVAPLTALPRGSAVALGVAALFMALHLGRTAAAARDEEAFQLVDGFSRLAIRWLSAVDEAAAHGADEIVVPLDPITGRLFGVAHRLFLCARYNVRPLRDLRTVAPRPGLAVVEQPAHYTPDELHGWRSVVHECQQPSAPAAGEATTAH